jgi:3',5'-cyclic AMP phosphodiesterase CpdA
MIAQENRFPQFSAAGDRFRFVLFADPQVGHGDDPNPVAANTRRTLRLGVEEVNAMTPAPLFAAFLGDLVNVFDDASVATFEGCIAGLKPKPVLVHGNHDTRPPFDGFKALMGRVCGFEAVCHSFDAGKWHFVVIPCNLAGGDPACKQAEQEVFSWLEADLAANAGRPTMVFNHLHLMPQGLSQLEWYCFPLELRLRLLGLFAKHGSVRYYFNGHVHNGIKASVKTSWQYGGTTFITVPTGTQSRNFGEEYAGFEQGLETGGYYLVVDVDGESVKLTGRLAGKTEGYAYPDKMQAFRTDIEARWLTKTTDFPPAPAVANGKFQDGLRGWQACYRYKSDMNPGYMWEPAVREGRNAVQILTRTKDPVFWANDELTALYQTVASPVGAPPGLRASYWIDDAVRDGGGYVRLNAMKDDAFLFAMMFRWGRKHERYADILVRCFANEVYGEPRGWLWLQELGRKKQGLFWELPETPDCWHRLDVNLANLYDQALGAPGAFAALGVTKWHLGLGTWVTNREGAVSAACFTDLALHGDAADKSMVDGKPLAVDDGVFVTEFGQDIEDRVSKKSQKKAKKNQG